MSILHKGSPTLAACLIVLSFTAATQAEQTNAPVVAHTDWAQPIKAEGLPNLHKVSDTLYRGAQPTAEGLKTLKKMEIKTVVNLRAFHSDKDELGDTQLASESISFKTWHPEQEDIIRFLQIVTDTNKLPVFVHCQHGADRTGTMCAIYRIVAQGWSKEEAIEEMTKGGFGFHPMWRNLISFIRRLDIDALKTNLNSPAPATARPQIETPQAKTLETQSPSVSIIKPLDQESDHKFPVAHIALLFSFLLILGIFFAQVEIQIEGPNGWASSLPTWRIDDHPLLYVFWGGKTLTGYHLWVFTFMLLVFHLPLVVSQTFSWRMESRIIGSVMVFWIIEDFFWFIMNPHFGFSKFKRRHVPWHKYWICGVPSDYFVFTFVGAALIWWSFVK